MHSVRFKMMSWTMLKSILMVLAVTIGMCYVVNHGYLSSMKVELGSDHYAERVHISMKKYLPKWIKMPFNTFVNIGYVIVGAAWCAITSVALSQDKLRKTDAEMFYVFNFASCCYGPIQALRVLTQIYKFGVLDQWYTTPFFIWVFLWGLHIVHGYSLVRIIMWMSLCIGSYCLTGDYIHGFEICLSVHIFLAVFGALYSWWRVPQARCAGAFVGAIVSCAGFVILKLADLELVKHHEIFKYFSGHFISKIFDIMQIHYVNKFFLAITLAALADSKKKKE